MMSINKVLVLSKNLMRECGFTLLELMVTLVIAAIVMGLAIPSFNAAIKNNRLTTDANAYITSLNFARSEAIKRGHQVNICKSADGAACTLAGDWAQGWLVYADQDNDNIFDAAEAPPLRMQTAMQDRVTMIGSASVASIVRYAATGLAIIPVMAGGRTVKVCDERVGNFGKLITFSAIGRATTTVNEPCP